jgi:hypothetical protein
MVTKKEVQYLLLQATSFERLRKEAVVARAEMHEKKGIKIVGRVQANNAFLLPSESAFAQDQQESTKAILLTKSAML